MKDPRPPRSMGSEYAEHILAVVHRARELERQRPTPPPPPRLLSTTLKAAVTVCFAAVVVWNVQAWSPRPEVLPRPLQESALEVSLLAASRMVEAYREKHGMLPATLSAAGLPDAAFSYHRDDDQYELFASEGGLTVRFHSQDGTAGLLARLAVTSDNGA